MTAYDAVDEYDATAEAKGRPTLLQRELAFAAAESARQADPTEQTFVRLAGLATREGVPYRSWIEARLCDCADDQHPVLPAGAADREWYWTPDVAQVEACRVFFPGAPHVHRRRVVVLTLDGAA